MNDRRIDEVNEFWFGEPARDGEALARKLKRWFEGSRALDEEIRTRFGEVIAAALDDALASWVKIPEGRVALVVVLDQFTRHAFRGTPRAYAGDLAAREIALGGIATGLDLRLPVEQRLFLSMPLAHAEDARLQHWSVQLARDLRDESPSEFHTLFARGYQHALQYRSIVDRFGRFPARNTILGRASTPDELAFLAAHTPLAAPSLA